MRITPAEPLGYGATELAFVLYEVHAMSLTVLDAATHTYSCTLAAHELLLLEVLIVVLSSLAVFHTSEIWFIAFVALIIRESLHGISLQIIKECISWFLQAWILVQVLKLGSLHGLLEDYFLELELLLQSSC